MILTKVISVQKSITSYEFNVTMSRIDQSRHCLKIWDGIVWYSARKSSLLLCGTKGGTCECKYCRVSSLKPAAAMVSGRVGPVTSSIFTGLLGRLNPSSCKSVVTRPLDAKLALLWEYWATDDSFGAEMCPGLTISILGRQLQCCTLHYCSQYQLHPSKFAYPSS